jgi:hypothetical protein
MHGARGRCGPTARARRAGTLRALAGPVLLALAGLAACQGEAAPPRVVEETGAVGARTTATGAPTATVDTVHAPGGADPALAEPALPDAVVIPDEPPVFERPEHMRGLYLNAWTAGSSRRMEQLLALARATEINTFVIDIKDASGYVSHATAVAAAREVGATGELRIRRLPALLARLHAEGIYPVARIVVVKDPVLIAARPELAVQDTAGGAWVDSKGFVWLNPYDRRVWDYHVELAREVVALGFPEVQWDYIRFPDAPASDMERALFPGDSLGDRPEAIRQFLAYAREALAESGAHMTADVFGVTTTFRRDVGIGQLWERFIDQVDAALPMVYPSHYWQGSYGFDKPNAHPYEVVRQALEDARARSEAVAGAGRVIPWLQDFTLGAPAYGAPEVRAQIQATYDAGLQEWVLWNPSSRYTEAALEPTGGFPTEPLIRVAGTVTPVSRRHALLAPVAAGSSSPSPEIRPPSRR